MTHSPTPAAPARHRGHSSASAAERLRRLFPERAEASLVTVSIPRRHYSAAMLARAVEDADAHVLNLNVTADDTVADAVTVELRVGHRSPAAVCRSLERYGYEVLDAQGLSDEDDSVRQRVNALIHFLDLNDNADTAQR